MMGLVKPVSTVLFFFFSNIVFREEQPWGSFLFQEFGGEEVLPLGLLEALHVGLLMSLSLLLVQLC